MKREINVSRETITAKEQPLLTAPSLFVDVGCERERYGWA